MKVCSVPGCPNLTESGQCKECRAKARRQSDSRRPSSADRGYDQRWRGTRSAYLQAHPICEDESGCLEEATDVDHIDGEGPLGPRGHDWSNLRALCHSHHSQRTARDQPGGWNRGPTAVGPVLILAGLSGVGKTAVRSILASRLKAKSLGPDDFEDGWQELITELDQSRRAVVECVRIPGAVMSRGDQRHLTVVEMTAPLHLRRERLIERGEASDVVTARLTERGSLGYGKGETGSDLLLDAGSKTPAQLAAAVIKHLPRSVWSK